MHRQRRKLQGERDSSWKFLLGALGVSAVKSLSFPHQFQQLNQLLQFVLSDVAEHFPAKLFEGPIHFAEKLQPGRSDLSVDDAAIELGTRALDEAAIFQTIEQARNVGIARDHAPANLAAWQALLPRPAQNAQGVVLRSGKAKRFEP